MLLKSFLGLVCFMLGIGYLFRPDIIERLNNIIRNTILNDSYIALERRKWGFFFLLLGILFLCAAIGPHMR
jgi:hypothetical protein